MRSDSEPLFLVFDLKKGWACLGLLMISCCIMQSDIAKSDGIESDLRIRWPMSSEFGPKSTDSAHRILILKGGIPL